MVGAGRQAQGHPLLRPVQPRVGHPRDRRPAAARLPDALVQQRRVQAVGADRPPVPARLHRQVLGAVRRQRQRRGAPGDRRRLLRVHGRADPAVHQRHRAGDVQAASERARLRAGRAAARRPRGRWSGRWRSRPWCSATAPTPTSIALAEDPLEVAVQVFYVARRPDPRPARLGRGSRRRGRRPDELVEHFLLAAVRRGRAGRVHPARDPGAGAAARPGDRRAAARRPARCRRSRSGCRSAGTRRRCRRPWRRNAESVAGAAQDQAGERPHHPQPGAAGDPGGAGPRRGRRCGSSATTSPTCRAPRSWPRWWCSRTAWPARASTAAS